MGMAGAGVKHWTPSGGGGWGWGGRVWGQKVTGVIPLPNAALQNSQIVMTRVIAGNAFLTTTIQQLGFLPLNYARIVSACKY